MLKVMCLISLTKEKRGWWNVEQWCSRRNFSHFWCAIFQ